MTQRNLIILAIVITILAFVAAEADFWSDHQSFPHHTFQSTLVTSFGIAYGGDVELNEDQTAIVRMSPDARLDVRERRFTARRRLEVRPDAAGRPTYHYKTGARERSQAEAEAYLASVMDDIVRRTTFGAQARARRLRDEEGLDVLLREVGRLDSNAARRIYLEVAADLDGLDVDQAREIVRTAGREMTSSSRLRATLVGLAEDLPEEWELSAELVDAAENVASSSERRRTLVEVARHRGIAPHEESFAEAASTIPSMSERGRAITHLYDLEPTPELAGALLTTADTLQASSERRRALIELAAQPDLPEPVYSKALDVAADIAASSEKAAVLAAMAPHLPTGASAGGLADESTGEDSADAGESDVVADAAAQDDATPGPGSDVAGEEISQEAVTGDAVEEATASEAPAAPTGRPDALRREYIRLASSISSSAEAKRALLALSTTSDLSEELCRVWLDSTEQIASTSVAADLVVEGAAICPGSDGLWRTYLDRVERLAASSEQRRALMALLEREDLSESTLRKLSDVAERSIASASDREAVLERVDEVRRQQVS